MALPILITKDAFAKSEPRIQSEYKDQGDGTYKLDTIPYEDAEKGVYIAVEDIGGLKRTAAATRSERDQMKARMMAFEGLDPEAARKALKKVEDFEKEKPDEKAERRIKQAEEKFQNELAAREKALADLERELDDEILTTACVSALAKQGIKDPEVLLPHVKSRGKTIKDSRGKRLPVAVDSRGEPVPTGKGTSMDPMHPDELVERMRKEERYAPYFPSNPATGSGAGGPKGAGGASVPNPNPSSVANPTERLKVHRRAQQTA